MRKSGLTWIELDSNSFFFWTSTYIVCIVITLAQILILIWNWMNISSIYITFGYAGKSNDVSAVPCQWLWWYGFLWCVTSFEWVMSLCRVYIFYHPHVIISCLLRMHEWICWLRGRKSKERRWWWDCIVKRVPKLCLQRNDMKMKIMMTWKKTFGEAEWEHRITDMMLLQVYHHHHNNKVSSSWWRITCTTPERFFLQ